MKKKLLSTIGTLLASCACLIVSMGTIGIIGEIEPPASLSSRL